MSDIIIKAEGLGKKYLIGHKSERESYIALRDVLVRNVKGALNKTRQVLRGQQLLAGDEIEEFWALKDIYFEIKRGDRVGIIGRNGAGKSTLLKILSRITEPSLGRVEIHGRVASLLEVGTGFHPELTGRENIFLNGAILGMTRIEVRKKFDEIVDFAGVEKFLDTPVKRYSSGMYVRLAFAIAAHLEPEILIVDEVLAVGDSEFQKKCLGKMEEVSRNEGRTVLFVSHDLAAIEKLTKKCLYLHHGENKYYGLTNNAIEQYLFDSTSSPKTDALQIKGKKINIISASILKNLDKEEGIGCALTVCIDVHKKTSGEISLELILKNQKKSKIVFVSTKHFYDWSLPDEIGSYQIVIKLKELNLAAGTYYLDIIFSEPNVSWDVYWEDALNFEVTSCNPLDGAWNLKSSFGYGDIAWEISDVNAIKTLNS